MAFFSNDNDELKDEIRSINQHLRNQNEWYKQLQVEIVDCKNKIEELENELWLERKKSEDLLRSLNHKHSENQRLHKKINQLKNPHIDENGYLKLT